jgi:hypothetical protein
MTGQDLIGDLLQSTQKLSEAVSDYRKDGIALAKAEHKYRIEKALKIAELKADGWAATITEVMANGHLTVADARYERDRLDALHRADIELIQAMKREQDILKIFYQKELG